MTRWISLMAAVVLASAAVAGAPEGGAAEAQRRFDNRQYEEAEALATRLLEKDGADTEARLVRARARFALQRYEVSLRDVEELLRSGPKPEYYHVRAGIRMAMGQLAEGFADLQRAAELDRDEVGRAVKKALVQFALTPNWALKTLDDAIAVHPKEPQLYSIRSLVQIRRSNFDRALADARTARDVAPDDPQYADGYAHRLLSCGRAHAARDEATAALKRFPRHAPLYGTRCRANLELGRVDEAEADALKSAELEPASGQSHLNLAHCRVAAKRYAEAVLDYQTAAEFARKEPHHMPGGIQAQLSRLLSRCPDGAVRDGEAALRLARQLAPPVFPGEEFDTLASAYAELGQFDKAVEAQEKAVQWVKNGPEFKPYSERLELYKQGKPCRESKFER
jgi:tetratricopeptide (TPR) repeat protein